MILDQTDLEGMERRYRTAFVNSLSGFKAANLVGSVDASGTTNLAMMSSAVHLGAHPPLLGLILRPDAARQHTLANILGQGRYTVNHVAERFYTQAHQTAARYPGEVSEFEAVGLSPEWLGDFPAPFVGEAAIRLGLALREHLPLVINGTHLIIGEVMLVDVPEACIAEDGAIDLAAAGTVAVSGLDSYHRPEPLGRLPYAKP